MCKANFPFLTNIIYYCYTTIAEIILDDDFGALPKKKKKKKKALDMSELEQAIPVCELETTYDICF